MFARIVHPLNLKALLFENVFKHENVYSFENIYFNYDKLHFEIAFLYFARVISYHIFSH